VAFAIFNVLAAGGAFVVGAFRPNRSILLDICGALLLALEPFILVGVRRSYLAFRDVVADYDARDSMAG